MDAIVGIDQGTSGTRVRVYNVGLKLLADSYRPVVPQRPRPGWVEHDPEDLLASVTDGVEEALLQAGNPSVAAVGLANQGETVVAWDRRTGRPLAPAIVWQDQRSQVVVERLHATGAERYVRERTGLPLTPYFSAPKLTWLLEEVPEVQAAARAGTLCLGTSDAFLRARLTGSHETDTSTASRTQLFNIDELRWDDELLRLFSIPPEALPSVRQSVGQLALIDWHPVGVIPLCASLVDQQAALAGHACFRRGMTKCTFGTGCFVLAHAGEESPRRVDGVFPTVAWTIGKTTDYALEGGVLAAGTCLTWLKEIGIIDTLAEIDDVASRVASTDGVRFLPALAGLGAPWWASSARGVWAGLGSGTTKGHLVRAVLESIAFRVRDIVEALGTADLDAPKTLRVDGGLTASAVLMQLQADVLGMPVERAEDPELTAWGVAALAALGAGLLSDTTAIERLRPIGATIEPREAAAATAEAYHAWRTFLASARNL